MKNIFTTFIFALLLSTVIQAQTITAANSADDSESLGYTTTLLDENTEMNFSVIDAESNVSLSNIDYDDVKNQIAFNTDTEIQFVEIYKGAELYMSAIPVFAKSFHFSINNFESGLYHIYLISDVNKQPTITQVLKK